MMHYEGHPVKLPKCRGSIVWASNLARGKASMEWLAPSLAPLLESDVGRSRSVGRLIAEMQDLWYFVNYI